MAKAVGIVLALLVVSGQVVVAGELQLTCVRCECSCDEPPCDPPDNLPTPCALEEATLDAFVAQCGAACATVGALGRGVPIEADGAPCPPCGADGSGRAAAPALATLGLVGLAFALAALGARAQLRR